MASVNEDNTMMTSSQKLTVALRSLIILEEALEALRGQLAAANPALLAATSPAYVQRIASLRAEIAAYLYAHPPTA